MLLRLGTTGSQEIGRWRMPQLTWREHPYDFAVARGDVFHVIVDGQWHRWRLEQFLLASA